MSVESISMLKFFIFRSESESGRPQLMSYIDLLVIVNAREQTLSLNLKVTAFLT